MEGSLHEELLAKTKQALDAHDWDAVVRLWQPCIEQGDAEAEFQLAYHYLWCTPCEDQIAIERMEVLLRDAAAKDHPDAMWFLAARQRSSQEANPELDRLLLRAGQLGSVNAQRASASRTRPGTGPDPRTSRKPCAVPPRRGEGQRGISTRFRLHATPRLGRAQKHRRGTDVARARWRIRRIRRAQRSPSARGLLRERTFRFPRECRKGRAMAQPAGGIRSPHTPSPGRRYGAEDAVMESILERLWDIDGVTGFVYLKNDSEFYVCYDPAIITPAELDEKIRAMGISIVPTTA